MATRAVNPYYNDPNIEAIASNIRRAFVDPNPGQTAVMRQHGRLYGLQADEIERKQRARSSIAGIFRQAQNGTLSPDQVAQLAAAGAEGGVDPKDPSQYTLYLAANGGAAAPIVGRAYVGTGHTIGENQGVTVEDREAVAGRADAARAQRSQIAAGPGYARVAEERRNNDQNFKYKQENPTYEVVRGRAARSFIDGDPNGGVALLFAPHNTPLNATTQYANGDPRVGGPKVDGPQSPDRLAVVPAEDGEGAQYAVPKPGDKAFPPPSAVPKTPTPMHVAPTEMNTLVLGALGGIDGAVVADGNYAKIDDDFQRQFGPEIDAARQTASRVLQETKDSERARAAFLSALGMQAGQRWAKTGTTLGFGGTKTLVDANGNPVERRKSAVTGAVTGGGTPTPPPAVAAPAPASAQSAPAAVPPPAQRVPGQTYMTPKGAMRWTGTGWVPPDNVR